METPQQKTIEMAIIENFIEVRSRIVYWFERSYYATKIDLAHRLGVSRPTLDRKIREKDFTPEELLIILKIVQP